MAVSPSIKFSEFAVSGVNPSGSRHLTTHGAYVKQLGTAAGQYLDFGSLNLNNGKQSTPTKAVIAFVTDMKDATESLFNLKFWISNSADFTSGTYYFNGWASGLWLRNCALVDSSGYYTPTIIPSGQNWRRQDGYTEISGANLDSEVTQYMYLSVTADIDVPNKTYGGVGGGFTYRLTFDYK